MVGMLHLKQREMSSTTAKMYIMQHKCIEGIT